jgi:hypothetical protein
VKELVMLSLSSYAVTFVIASSSLFEPLREWVKVKAPYLQIGYNKHMVVCRMCVGFWVSLAVCWHSWEMILPVYGLSYFLATLEK